MGPFHNLQTTYTRTSNVPNVLVVTSFYYKLYTSYISSQMLALAAATRCAGRTAFYRLQNRQLLSLATKHGRLFRTLPRQTRHIKPPFRSNLATIISKKTSGSMPTIALISALTAGAGVCCNAAVDHQSAEVFILFYVGSKTVSYVAFHHVLVLNHLYSM